jgi:hypothetical protein
VTAELAGKGYQIYGAGIPANSANSAFVDMDMVGYLADKDGNYDPQTLAQITDGWFAVSGAYPKAKMLIVITRYQGKYGIQWNVTAADFSTYAEKKTSEDDFWSSVFDAIKVFDLKTGKEVSPKDFMNKTFGTG